MIGDCGIGGFAHRRIAQITESPNHPIAQSLNRSI
jgi:hypothetical protein